MSVVIRPALLEDAPALARFAAQAFTDTYRGLDDEQEIADYVAEHFPADVMAGVIADPACTTLLAWVGDELAGYAMLSAQPAPGCVSGPDPLKLWRLYLGQGFIGQGLGARLMAAVHARAHGQGARTLWLSVYDRNVRAVRFYERFGFAQVGNSEFLFGGRVYIDPIYATAVQGE
ncbi:GNAT family N-acetyltransferase [Roseateles asaccharophilus]|uniref:Ribosomal protein S18 acetylase RimI-like enzyme n=1 Tax=Roseateles asaccharophilus TaxID=582607 RepID=A0ABU2A1A4_9BURK|nr:GNAT family N-acetyltransferase [Roseateles asaccharophilus]MDR7330956.1 ribosomal protein S18 acetylase RimI-like enzyme [Roseateles asaccharophilus]